MADFDPSAPNPGVSTSENLGDEVAEVEVEASVRDNRDDRTEGGPENTGSPHTKDTTAKQSIGRYDNYRADDFSFEARRAATRDANSAIGDYVSRVAGINDAVRDRARQWEGNEMARSNAAAASASSEANALAAARMDRTQFSDSSSYVDDWRAGQQAVDDRIAASNVDKFSDYLSQSAVRQAESGIRSEEDTLAAQLATSRQLDTERRALRGWADARPSVDTGNEFGDYVSQSAAREREASLAASQADQQTVGASVYGNYDQIRIDRLVDERVEQNRRANLEKYLDENIKQANAVIASEDTTVEQKVEAVAKKNAAVKDKSDALLSKYNPDYFYSAVKDPEGSRKAKDLEVDQSFAQLNQNINNTSVRPGLFGINFTHHDNKTIRQVQAMITAWEGTYMDHLSDMGKRNSKTINDKGFDLSKGISGFNFIQAMANKLGWAYHATETEKQLRALRIKWNLDEAEHGDGPSIDDLKKRCNERSGYKWDEESNSCVPISNLNTDYQNYLP